MSSHTKAPLYLCAGLQSSGSTLVSWCFLQRRDTDGVLDARNDVIPHIPAISRPRAWCKFTISSFRFTEMIGHFRDEGWEVHPVLVVRDVRAIFNSLLSKPYGSNGITAEEPPLRMRLRRFREDWEALKGRCAVVIYERMLTGPQATLRKACDDLNIDWDPAMLEWPKPLAEIADPGHGSPTFRKSRGSNFGDTADLSLIAPRVDRIPPGDLDWIEEEFAEFNRDLGYPARVSPAGENGHADPRAVPSWENTRRYRNAQKPLAKLTLALERVRDSLRYVVFPSYRRTKGRPWRERSRDAAGV